MSHMRLLTAGLVVGASALLFVGCQPKEQTAAEQPSAEQVEKTATEAAATAEKTAAEHPEAARPKDHPAH